MPESSSTREILIAQATIDFQRPLDILMENSYPRIDTPTGFKDYREGKIPFGSFHLPSTNPDSYEILSQALFWSVQPGVAYCQHAAKGHPQTLIDVVHYLRENAAKKFNPKELRAELSTNVRYGLDNVPHNIHRLVITGEPVEKQTMIPNAQFTATIIKNLHPTHLARELRKIAEKGGKQYASMAGIYAGVAPSAIFEALHIGKNSDDPSKRFQGGKGRDLTIAELGILRDYLTVDGHPIYGQQPLENAYDFMTRSSTLKDGLDPTVIRMMGARVSLIPRAVFSYMDEIAQGLGDERWVDPARTDYIDRKFGKLVSTRMVTAYFLTG